MRIEKNLIVICGLLAAVTSQSVIAASDADNCGNMADHKVERVSFAQLPIGEAVSRIAAGSKLTVVPKDIGSTIISAKDISGSLDAVLADLSAKAGFVYKKKGCVLSLYSTKKWIANTNDSLMNTLAAWSKQAEWQLVWDIKEDFVLQAGSTFGGEFDEAVTELIGILNRDARSLRVTFYEGNKVLRISSNMEGSFNE